MINDVIYTTLWSKMAAERLVTRAEVGSFVKRCMTSVGTPEEHASSLADILVTADYRGHFSHGLNRLGNRFVVWFVVQPL